MKRFLLVFACILVSNITSAQSKTEPVSYRTIQNPPVYPGCTGDTEALKKCFTQSVQRHLAMNFDMNLLNNPKYNSENVKLFILFTIDQEGKAGDVKVSRAPHPKLEEESKRVIQLLPVMTPGKVEGKSVAVKYILPFKMNRKNN